MAVKHTREGKDVCEHLFNTPFPSAEVQISCLAYKTKKHLKQLENFEVNQREFIRTAATSINPPQTKLKNAKQNHLGKSMQCYMEQMQFYCNAGRHSEEHRKKRLAVVLCSWARTMNLTLVHSAAKNKVATDTCRVE